MNSAVRYLLQTRDEVMKVTWPTQAQIIRLTLVVLIISLVVGLYVGGLDYILTQAMQLLIK